MPWFRNTTTDVAWHVEGERADKLRRNFEFEEIEDPTIEAVAATATEEGQGGGGQSDTSASKTQTSTSQTASTPTAGTTPTTPAK